MSSENQQRFESLQREFAAYAEHVMTQAPKPKSKSKPKQEFLSVLSPIAIEAVSTATPRKGAENLSQMRQQLSPLWFVNKLIT